MAAAKPRKSKELKLARRIEATQAIGFVVSVADLAGQSGVTVDFIY
jgi:hypothetical protein